MPAWRKPVHAITDRAKRYRANHPDVRPAGQKVCAHCGTRRNVGVGHRDGNESNLRPSNLEWICKRHNALEAIRLQRLGRGVKTRQYNPQFSERDRRELSSLFRTARIAGADTWGARIEWAAREWAKTHPGEKLKAYKYLSSEMRGYGINPPDKIAGHAGWMELTVNRLLTVYDGWRKAGLSAKEAEEKTLASSTAGPGSIAEFRKRKRNPEGIPVKINRHIYFAVFSPRESALPNAMPTYRLYDKNGNYFMNMVQWEVDKKRVNPGAVNLAQYVQAAMQHTRGAHDAGGKIIHETPPHLRRIFARDIWGSRRAHGTDFPSASFAMNPRLNAEKTAQTMQIQMGTRRAEKAAREWRMEAHGDAVSGRKSGGGGDQLSGWRFWNEVLEHLSKYPQEPPQRFYGKRRAGHYKKVWGENPAMPLRGHPFHDKSDASLLYIIKDAGEAARNMQAMGNAAAEGKYLDQMNDAATVLRYRRAKNPAIVEIIRPGDRVTILVHAGGIGKNMEWKQATGRAVMRSSTGGWVLNMGGPHGRPGLADEENIVAVKPARRRNPAIQEVGAGKWQVDNGRGSVLVLVKKPHGWEVHADNASARRSSLRGFGGVSAYNNLAEVERKYKAFRGISKMLEPGAGRVNPRKVIVETKKPIYATMTEGRSVQYFKDGKKISAEEYKRSGASLPDLRKTNPGPGVTALLVVRGRDWQQESYETATGDAGRRARQLRALGFKAAVEAMGSQVTPLGLMKLSLVTIAGIGDREVPPPDKVERMNPSKIPPYFRNAALRNSKKLGNPSATELYTAFHGRGPDRTDTISVPTDLDPYDSHPEIAKLGRLMRLIVGEDVKMGGKDGDTAEADGANPWAVVLDFRDKNPPDAAGSTEGGHQIYFAGGDQNLEPYLAKIGCDTSKNICDCGFCVFIEYHTKKGFDQFQPVDYFHHFGEDSGVYPRLIFNRKAKLFQLVGGEYKITPRGIEN